MSSASVRPILFPFFIVPLVSLNILEEISSLSYSVVFLYFFALFALKDFLISA